MAFYDLPEIKATYTSPHVPFDFTVEQLDGVLWHGVQWHVSADHSAHELYKQMHNFYQSLSGHPLMHRAEVRLWNFHRPMQRLPLSRFIDGSLVTHPQFQSVEQLTALTPYGDITLHRRFETDEFQDRKPTTQHEPVQKLKVISPYDLSENIAQFMDATGVTNAYRFPNLLRELRRKSK